jgi:hypothetical protein
MVTTPLYREYPGTFHAADFGSLVIATVLVLSVGATEPLWLAGYGSVSCNDVNLVESNTYVVSS